MSINFMQLDLFTQRPAEWDDPTQGNFYAYGRMYYYADPVYQEKRRISLLEFELKKIQKLKQNEKFKIPL